MSCAWSASRRFWVRESDRYRDISSRSGLAGFTELGIRSTGTRIPLDLLPFSPAGATRRTLPIRTCIRTLSPTGSTIVSCRKDSSRDLGPPTVRFRLAHGGAALGHVAESKVVLTLTGLRMSRTTAASVAGTGWGRVRLGRSAGWTSACDDASLFRAGSARNRRAGRVLALADRIARRGVAHDDPGRSMFPDAGARRGQAGERQTVLWTDDHLSDMVVT